MVKYKYKYRYKRKFTNKNYKSNNKYTKLAEVITILDSDRPKRIKKWLDMCSVSSDLMVNLLNFSQDVTNSSNKQVNKKLVAKLTRPKHGLSSEHQIQM